MKNKIEKQFDFCIELMQRLGEDYKENKNIPSPWYSGMFNRTQMQNDIRRLRRELIKLHKMLGGEE